ncbi:MAG: amidohydrolase family protein [Armatimonadetes bacterium]|nr:amidohydrolase family protein [Armatimonadota bacterium]
MQSTKFIILALFACIARPLVAQNITAFEDFNVVPMESDKILAHTTVLVDGRKIIAVGPARSVSIPKNCEVVKGHGKRYLIPGLADMHTHIDEQEDLLLLVASGVTTMLNMGHANGQFITTTRQSVNEGKTLGPYTFAGFWIDGVPESNGFYVTKPEDAKAAVESAHKLGYEFIKAYSLVSPECFRAICATAKGLGMPVVGHGQRNLDFREAAETGLCMLAHAEEYFYTYFAKGKGPEAIPDAVQITKETGLTVTANLSAYHVMAAQWGKPDVLKKLMEDPDVKNLRPENRDQWEGSELARNKGSLDKRVPFLDTLVKSLQDAGVPLLAGTDTPGIPGLPPGKSLRTELELLVKAGLTPYEALSCATRNAGGFISGVLPNQEKFGHVAVGERADLVILDGNPLKDIANVNSMEGVVVAGKYLPKSKLDSMVREQSRRFEAEVALQKEFEASLKANGLAKTAVDFSQPRGKIALREHYLNNLGYACLGAKKIKQAVTLFQLNVKLHPESANVYDSLGEALLASGDKEAGRKAYAKAAELDPTNSNAAKIAAEKD